MHQASRSNRNRRLWWFLGILALFATIFMGWRTWTQNAAARAVNRYQSLMGLTSMGSFAKRAPNFTFVDQSGKTVSLRSLHGKVVVLTFMDPLCTTICPVISQEFVDAAHTLGHNMAQVEFLAINVNQYHAKVQDVQKFTDEHGLNQIPNWHFLTGSTAALQAAWKAYGIYVIPSRTGDAQHSSIVYFIGKHGRERYVANPDSTQTTIPQWGDGIASVVKLLL